MKSLDPIPIIRAVPLLIPVSGLLMTVAVMQSPSLIFYLPILILVSVAVIVIASAYDAESVLLFMSGCFLGLFVIHLHADHEPDRLRDLMDRHELRREGPVEILGVVGAVPEIAPSGFSFVLKVRAVSEVRFCRLTRGDLSVRVMGHHGDAKMRPGQWARVACVPRREEMFRNPGGFRFVDHLDGEGIDAVCMLKSPLLIETSKQSIPAGRALLGEFRNTAITKLVSTLGPMHGGMVSAVVFGNKEFLDGRAAELFRQGGTFHLLIISGMHMTFIAGIVLIIVGFLLRSPWLRFAAVVPVIWIYAEMVGWDRPVTRACLMFTLVLFGRCIFRRPDPLNLILATAAISIAAGPSDLFSPSFQLSLLSVVSVTSVALPIIERVRMVGDWSPDSSQPFPPWPGLLRSFAETIYWNPRAWRLRTRGNDWQGTVVKHPFVDLSRWPSIMRLLSAIFEGIIATVSVQILLLPLQILLFHRLTPAGLVLNLIVAPLVALQAVLGLLATLSDGLAAMFSPVAVLVGELGLLISRILVSSGFSESRVPIYDGAGKTIYLLHLLLTMAFILVVRNWNPFERSRGISRHVRGLTVLLLTVTCLVISCAPLSQPRPDGRLSVHFLDVGQGDSTFIVFPNGETMLIDAGGLPLPVSPDSQADFVPDAMRVGESVVSEFLWEKGYSRIDHVIATHSDADHIQGLRDIVANFEVGRIHLGQMREDSRDFRELVSAARANGVGFRRGFTGDNMEIAGVRVEFLHPARGPAMGSSNEGSLVVRLTFGDHAFLMTGDIESEGERHLLGRRDISADVIKVPHHGSRTSSSTAFIDAVDATHAVIPVGRRSRFGHPHEEVVQRWRGSGAVVLTTGEHGTITFTSDGRKMECRSFAAPIVSISGGNAGCR